MVAQYKVFRGLWTSWEKLLMDAAEFMTRLGPDRVISVSHSADQCDGVVTVWYWE